MTTEQAIVYNNEILETRVIPKKTLGKFQAIGELGGMADIFTRLRKVSKSAYDLFDDLKNTRDYKTNLCYLETKEFTSSQLNMFRSRIKELKDAGLIKKATTMDKSAPVKKGSYMLNPNLIMCTYAPEISAAMWRILK